VRDTGRGQHVSYVPSKACHSLFSPLSKHRPIAISLKATSSMSSCSGFSANHDLEKGIIMMHTIHPKTAILAFPPHAKLLLSTKDPAFSKYYWHADGSFKRYSHDLSISVRNAKPLPKAPKHSVSRWIRFQLWYNTYRLASCVYLMLGFVNNAFVERKFFTFVLGLNVIGVLLAASDKWSYARHYAGTLALGNIQFAILVRNEFFGRCLYLFVNTCFAKVSHSMRSKSVWRLTQFLSSGPLFGFGWAVHPCYSILVAFTRVARSRDAFGSFSACI
jgi:hypothetical protein